MRKKSQFHWGFLIWGLLLCGLAGGSFMHTTQWGDYSWEIIPLKVKQFSRQATASELKRIRTICEKRKMTACQHQVTFDLARFHPEQTEHLVNYASLLIEQDQSKEAEKVFRHLFKKKKPKNHPKAALVYGRLLKDMGYHNHAVDMFEKVIDPDLKGFDTVDLKSYIRSLVEAGQKKKAKQMILRYRRNGKRYANLFMESDLRRLGSRRPASR